MPRAGQGNTSETGGWGLSKDGLKWPEMAGNGRKWQEMVYGSVMHRTMTQGDKSNTW